ncbi:MAG: tetratricopeptide repeat protein [Gemmatimonadaceae bacterium]
MSWLSRLFGARSDGEVKPQRVDYLKEALLLERQGDFEAALTSYRLALREKPDDHRVLQNMAIAYSRTTRLDEAVRCYRRALEIKPDLAGAHYGLGFLLLKRGEPEGALRHLESFLAAPPKGAEAARWVTHARSAIEEIQSGGGGVAGSGGTTGAGSMLETPPNDSAPTELRP